MSEGMLMFVRRSTIPRTVRMETVGLPICPDDEVRLLDDEDNDRAARRGRRALRPRPLHAARLFRRARAQSQSLHLGRLLPLGRSDAAASLRQLHGRGPQEGPDQPRRREDQRRGDREPDPLASRRCRTSPASPCPMPMLGERMCACVILAPGKTLTLQRAGRLSPDQGDRQIQAARAAGGDGRLPAVDIRQGVEERMVEMVSAKIAEEIERDDAPMRKIDLHCYPNTEPWIHCQGPYVEALAKYWNRAVDLEAGRRGRQGIRRPPASRPCSSRSISRPRRTRRPAAMNM